MVKPLPRLQLQGFNNLTKALSFNIYDICYAVSEDQRAALHRVHRRGVRLRSPHEDPHRCRRNHRREHPQHRAPGLRSAGRVGDDPHFRASDRRQARQGHDLGRGSSRTWTRATSRYTRIRRRIRTTVSRRSAPTSTSATCGVISPLKALNYMIDSFESDIVTMDYRVRGFTRDVKGRKHYIDHRINSIQEYLAKHIQQRYEMFGRQRLSGKHLPHEDAREGLRSRHVPFRRDRRRSLGSRIASGSNRSSSARSKSCSTAATSCDPVAAASHGAAAATVRRIRY